MKGQYLSPSVLQIFGVFLIAGSAIFWAVTGQQSALLVGAGITLCALGAYSGLHISVKQDLYKPEPKDDGNDETKPMPPWML